MGWYLTDRMIEPRLAGTAVDGDPADMPTMEEPTRRDRLGFFAGMGSILVGLVVLLTWAWPGDSALRSPDGELTAFTAPLMQMLVPLIFVFFLIPGVVHGYVAGTVKSHRDIVDGMSDAMRTMAYYLVMAFFAAQFIAAFSNSNVGLLIALEGASILRDLGLPPQATVVGIIVLTAVVNLFVGSASAKWAVLSVIFVPMLMSLGISPELTQAAYRVGDSVTNITTPLMPYFPLVVVFCQRYVKQAGIGTLLSLMIPYTVAMFVTWTLFLVGYWLLDIPLGLQATYVYP